MSANVIQDSIKKPHDTPFRVIGQPRFLVPPREDRLELLEQGVGSPEDVAANLAEMTRINRWLGGNRALTRHLYALLKRLSARGDALTLVDLGGGSGEIAQMIARWSQRHRMELKALPLDLELRHLRAQSAPPLAALQANALVLPFADHSVDVFISSLFLHHLSPEQIIHLLREVYRSARGGIVMSDLTRGTLPLLAFHLVQPIFARHPVTFHDGLLSIRRAYRPNELLLLAHEAGLSHARVHGHFPWRMTLVVEKPEVAHE